MNVQDDIEEILLYNLRNSYVVKGTAYLDNVSRLHWDEIGRWEICLPLSEEECEVIGHISLFSDFSTFTEIYSEV